MRIMIVMLATVLSVFTASAEELRDAVTDSVEVDELVVKEARKDSLCRKYGKEYGELLIENKIDLGMTMEMVKVVTERKFYNVRSRLGINDERYEEWMFDCEKAIDAIADTMEDKDAFLNLVAQVEVISAGALQKEFMKIIPYKYLKFRDGILIEFLEND